MCYPKLIPLVFTDSKRVFGSVVMVAFQSVYFLKIIFEISTSK